MNERKSHTYENQNIVPKKQDISVPVEQDLPAPFEQDITVPKNSTYKKQKDRSVMSRQQRTMKAKKTCFDNTFKTPFGIALTSIITRRTI